MTDASQTRRPTGRAEALAGGLRLGPYEILAPIGAGGMGEVYRARDTRLGRDVAVKVLPAHLASDPHRLRRFEQEARTVAALSHPNVLALFDVGTHEGAPFLVSELLQGQTLADVLLAGPLPVGRAVGLGAQIARGLAAAHARHVIHRDVKPSNVFVTPDGHAKILDFGIAKLTQGGAPSDLTAPDELPVTAVDTGTATGDLVGTVGYMAPEQVRGQPCDERTDLFAFGCVLYEMLAGRRAFKGDTSADTLSAILMEDPPALSRLRPSVSAALEQIVGRCLEKRPEDRFSSAHDLALALEATSGSQAQADERVPKVMDAGGASSRRLRPWRWVLAAAAVAVAVVALWPAIQRQQRVAWARNQALPEFLQLIDARDYWPAFRLAREIEAVLPGEPTVQRLRPRFTGHVRRVLQPSGARLLARPRSGGDADWVDLGAASGQPIDVPLGYSTFRVEHPGLQPREFGMSVSEFGYDSMRIGGALTLTKAGETPAGMVRLDTPSEGIWCGLEPVGSFAFAQEVQVGAFYVDAREVSNREFKRFVEAGGYRSREYWREPFIRDGKTLSWDAAVALFRDTTGRPGPATWEVGTFPQGTDDLPVTGVSWYEAAAYAAFAGKRLPSVYHFAVASGWFVGGDIVPGSNFSGKLAPVGSYAGSLNYWGLYDVAGNAREWSASAAGAGRFALGGAADGPAYMLWNTDAATRSPFDRDPMTGFRCIKPVAPSPRDALLDEPIPTRPRPDWSAMEPFSSDAWATWQSLLSRATGPLDARTEWTDDNSPRWRMEKVTFNASYPDDRVVAYLFLPKDVPPPYQAVIFVQPGYGFFVSSSDDGRNTQDMSFWDYLVKDGRAVVYPIYKGIYERGGGQPLPGDATMAFWVTPVKDIIRTIDYLETRKDIRADRIGYFGTSAAGDAGTMVCAVEKRFKAAVFQGAGLAGLGPFEREELAFARHCTTPVQMVNGRFDGYGQQPVFDALAAPADRKRHIELDGDHTLAGFEKDVIRVNLEWFDRWLGPVR